MAPSYEQFFLFGDSITQQTSQPSHGFSFLAALQERYIRRLDVVNRGFAGYNSTHALQILPAIIPSPDIVRIRYLLLFFGTNDSILSPFPQHVPLARYRANLITILTHPLIRAHDAHLILVTPAPICEYLHGELDARRGFVTPRRAVANTMAYAQVVREVGVQLGVAVVDLWPLMGGVADDGYIVGSKETGRSDNLRNLLRDGVHFNGKAYELFFGELTRIIGQTWPDETPHSLPFVFPKWNDLK